MASTGKSKYALYVVAVFVCVVFGVFFGVWYFVPLERAQVNIGDAAFDVEIVDTFLSRAKGLSGRLALPRGKGMLFVFPDTQVQNFWMKDMHFPIDIVWIYGNHVVGITENIPPSDATGLPLPLYVSPVAVDKVLEIGAGESARNEIMIGKSFIVH